MTRPRCERRPHPAAVIALIAGIVYTLIILASQVEAQPLPADQWTPDAHHTLARCVVGEAGWTASADHVAIADVLARRWRMRVKALPSWTFKAQVVAYCKGLRPRRAARQWVKALPYGDGPWPEDAGPHRRLWRAALRRLARWSEGRIKSPCKGASNWGGMDLADDSERAWRAIESGKWEHVVCSAETLNTFFRRVK